MDAETVHEHLDLDLDGPDGEDDNDTGGEDGMRTPASFSPLKANHFRRRRGGLR